MRALIESECSFTTRTKVLIIASVGNPPSHSMIQSTALVDWLANYLLRLKVNTAERRVLVCLASAFVFVRLGLKPIVPPKGVTLVESHLCCSAPQISRLCV